MKLTRLVLGVMVVGLLAGCASPASEYFTLVPRAAPARLAQAPAHPASFAIRVLPVSVPEQVDRPQIVLSTPGSDRVTLLNSSLWASPLSEEIRHALSDDLSARLGVLDIPAGTVPGSLPIWRIGVTVHRFDSVYDHFALLDATWTMDKNLGRDDKIPPRVCRAVVRVPVETGVMGVVMGQQQALQYFAGAIASQLTGETLDDQAGRVTLKGCV